MHALWPIQSQSKQNGSIRAQSREAYIQKDLVPTSPFFPQKPQHVNHEISSCERKNLEVQLRRTYALVQLPAKKKQKQPKDPTSPITNFKRLD